MGCGSSAADRAIGLDGHENVKDYVIAKNGQLFIEKRIPNVYKSTSEKIARLKNNKLNEINDCLITARKIVQSTKDDIEKRQPGSITTAQEIHKASFEKLFGLDVLIKNIEQQIENVHDQYEHEEKQILKDIRQSYERFHNSISVSTCKIPHINALPQSDRQKAFEWGNKYAQKQIGINNMTLKDKFDRKYAFSNFQHRFDNIASTKQLQQILSQMRQKAKKVTIQFNTCVAC